MASMPRVFVAQWVEMGLEKEGEEAKENPIDAEVYK